MQSTARSANVHRVGIAPRCAGRHDAPSKLAKWSLTAMITTFEFLASWIRANVDDDRGATLVEYALLVALIAVVCIVAITFLGNAASDKFSTVGSAVN
jgi:pilus assembly protein Flp/PilA